jgi:hypothetical protein
MAIWVFTEQKVELYQKSQQPLEAHYQKQANVMVRQAELSSIESEIKAIQSKLAEQKVEHLRKWQELQALKTPRNASVNQSASNPVQPSLTTPEVDKTSLEIEKTKDFVQALTEELGRRVDASIAVSLELEDAKLKASAEFAKAQVRFLWTKRLTTLLYAVVAITVLLLVAWVAVTLIGRRGRFKVKRVLVFGGATGLLSLLIGYQVLEFAGASLIAVLIVIGLLAFVPRSEDPQYI